MRTALPTFLAVVISCGCASRSPVVPQETRHTEIRTERPKASTAGPTKTPVEATSKRAIPLQVQSKARFTGRLGISGYMCGAGACGSIWHDFYDKIQPSPESAERLPTSGCGEINAAGYLLGVGEKVVLEQDEPGRRAFAFVDSADITASHYKSHLTCSIQAGGVSEHGEIGVTFDGRVLDVWNSTELLDLGHLFNSQNFRVEHVWSSPDGWLFANSGEWVFWSPTGGDPRVLAEGHRVGVCGNPIAGKRALLLDGDPARVVAIRTDGTVAPEIIGRSPLSESHCLAGHDSTVFLTGRMGSRAVVAVHENGAWQVVEFPSADGIGEPYVLGGEVFVAFPEEPRTDGKGDVFEAAGAVYKLEQTSKGWAATHKYVSSSPRKNGLFGFGLGAKDGMLFVNYLVDAAEPDPTDMGDAEVCSVAIEATPPKEADPPPPPGARP